MLCRRQTSFLKALISCTIRGPFTLINPIFIYVQTCSVCGGCHSARRRLQARLHTMLMKIIGSYIYKGYQQDVREMDGCPCELVDTNQFFHLNFCVARWSA